MPKQKRKKATSKIKTEWNLSILYKSLGDSQIEKDISRAEKAYNVFAKKYKKNNKYLKNDNALKKALSDYKKLSDIPISRALFYLRLSIDKDSRNEKARAMLNLVSQRLQKLSNVVVFFEINLSKIPNNTQKSFLTSKKLVTYQYLLKKIFQNGKFTLTEPEEKILTLKSLPAHTLWTQVVEKLVSKQNVNHKNRQIPLSEANSIIKELRTQKERKELHHKVMDKYLALGEIAESEMNAIVTNKKINDELRGYKEPYDATILGYENDKKSVLNLVKVVSDNFYVSQKFYALKAKMLRLPKLYYFDRAVSIGKTKKKITFENSYKILFNLFTAIDPKFGEILKTYVLNGQVDVYPKAGKASGAYCWGDHKIPTFLLLNHTNTFESLMTFSHEMGHGIHTEFSKSQPVFYEGYSTATAETASTLFEAFVFYDQFEKLKEKEKIIALHDKIQDDIQTIFRQVACFNFEVEIHKTIREKGNMTKEELAKCMNKHMKSYLGKVDLQDIDGYFFVNWSHIRRFFYVYTYAFGQLASKTLHAKYRADKSYIKNIKKFLSLGCSISPEDIFKSIGVDVTKPDFWKKGIKSIEEDVNLLERLVSKKQ